MLLLLLLVVVFMLVATSAARRSARRRREEYERQSEPGGGGEPQVTVASPFDLLFGGGSGWQSYEYDPQSGGWVDASDHEPEPPEQPPDQAQRRQQRRPRRQAPQSPLGSLFGGGMMGGDGSGNFDVQPPDELTNFSDVGGMA